MQIAKWQWRAPGLYNFALLHLHFTLCNSPPTAIWEDWRNSLKKCPHEGCAHNTPAFAAFVGPRKKDAKKTQPATIE